MQVPECNEVGKHVWRRARATVPALGLHRPLPGPVRAKRELMLALAVVLKGRLCVLSGIHMSRVTVVARWYFLESVNVKP